MIKPDGKIITYPKVTLTTYNKELGLLEFTIHNGNSKANR